MLSPRISGTEEEQSLTLTKNSGGCRIHEGVSTGPSRRTLTSACGECLNVQQWWRQCYCRLLRPFLPSFPFSLPRELDTMLQSPTISEAVRLMAVGLTAIQNIKFTPPKLHGQACRKSGKNSRKPITSLQVERVKLRLDMRLVAKATGTKSTRRPPAQPFILY